MKLYISIFIMLLSTSVSANVVTELRCKNASGDELSWNFTVASVPDRTPGIIQGTITKLSLNNGKTLKEYQTLFANTPSGKYWQEEGYSAITVSPSDITGVDTLKVKLNGELWDAMGSTDPSDNGKIFIDPGQIRLSFLNGKVIKRNFICAMQLL